MKDYFKRNQWKFYSLLFFGLMILCVCCFIKDETLSTILISVACSFIAGLALSFFSDVPDLISEIADRTNEAISSNKFLNNFSRSKLVDIRKKTISLLYKKKNIHYQKALELDNNIIASLERPVYKSFNEHHVVIVNQDGSLGKTVSISFEMVSNSGNDTIDIAYRSYLQNSYKQADEPIKLTKFIVSIDNSRKFNLVDKISTRIKDNSSDPNSRNPQCMSVFEMGVPKTLSSNNIEQFSNNAKEYTQNNTIQVLFDKTISVEIEYIIKDAGSENIYIRSFKHPAMQYGIVFQCPDKYRVSGKVFGLDLKPQYSTYNSSTISIRLDNCLLLPGEGAVIVFTKTS